MNDWTHFLFLYMVFEATGLITRIVLHWAIRPKNTED